MRWRSPRLWIAVASAAVVLGVALVDMGRSAPGPLSAVHGRDPKLTGFNSCAQCHGGWFGSMSEACLECHEVVETQIDGGEGLHGALGKSKAMECALCHSEHHGESFPIVNAQSFLQAGVENRQEFDHGMVGFEMVGKHLEQECSKCHANADVEPLPEGGQRYLGLSRECSTCHEDPHEGRMASACVQCHGQNSFQELHSTGHEQVLPLVGGHFDVACRDCHAAGSEHSLEAMGRGIEARACAGCHESPHTERFDGSEESCAACHRNLEHTEFAQATVSDEQHAASGFVLARPHAKVTCEQCHSGTTFEARYPGRDQETCQACHDDPHRGQFEETACLECHDGHRFEPHTFTVEKHALTSMELTGSHVGAECNVCHKDPVEKQPRRFRGTPAKCEQCHADAHRGFFKDPSCAACHKTTTFTALPDDGFDHGRWTGFDVAGAHAQEACESCHPRSGEADEFGRTFGRVAESFGKIDGCLPCHKDPHHGEFDRKDLPTKVDGQRSCARCHVQTSFRAFPRKFRHERWTGFALEGAHGEAACSACHAPLRKADRFGRTWARAKGSSCADCHIDVHKGQFRKNGRTDCARCHESTEAFSELDFNHNFDARFRLGKAHEALACSACHKPFAGAVRYRPLGRECGDCHMAQNDPLRRHKWRKNR